MQRLSVVVVHGSVSADYGQAFQSLMAQVQRQVDHPLLGSYLECTDIPLTQQITDFIQRYPDRPQVQILPLFLLPGVHVREDMPAAIATLCQMLPNIQFELLDYLGKAGRLAPYLEPQFAQYPTAQRILIAHGSRRAGANPTIAQLAQSLQAHTAYWSTEPQLEQTIAQVVTPQVHAICVVPYFLFPGAIPMAIAHKISELTATYPTITFHYGQPFGTADQCATAIAQILNNKTHPSPNGV